MLISANHVLAAEIFYHRNCLRKYERTYEISQEKLKKNEDSNVRNHEQNACVEDIKK